MKTRLLSAVILLWSMSSVQAESISVIVHPSNDSQLNKAQLKNIFLGKLKTFAGKGLAVPVSLPADSANFEKFSKTITNKNKKQWQAYWARNLFTGSGSPPKEVSEAEMLDLVSNNPNIIGFTTAANIPDNVKVIQTIE